jgi:hypothetical protein
MVRPQTDDEALIRFHFTATPNGRFATGLFPKPEAADTFEFPSEDLPYLYSGIFGLFQQKELAVDATRIQLVFPHGKIPWPDSLLTPWVERSARAVSAYYGKFPVPRLVVVFLPCPDDGICSGKSYGRREAITILQLGEKATADRLTDDWVLTHEMIHFALPMVAPPHHWLEEGIATYAEPIARYRVGNLTAIRVWGDLVRDLPQGLPKAGDKGLDFTPTWGRQYWGGALFCLLSDVEIREKTQNRLGLEDALRGILAAGGSMAEFWDLNRLLDTADRATGLRVLNEMYRRLAAAPVPTDLGDLWRRLGIIGQGADTRFNDEAPLAGVRRAILDGKK